MIHNGNNEIVSVGELAMDCVIDIKHDFLEKKIGIELDRERVQKIFESLGFGCDFCEKNLF